MAEPQRRARGRRRQALLRRGRLLHAGSARPLHRDALCRAGADGCDCALRSQHRPHSRSMAHDDAHRRLATPLAPHRRALRRDSLPPMRRRCTSRPLRSRVSPMRADRSCCARSSPSASVAAASSRLSIGRATPRALPASTRWSARKQIPSPASRGSKARASMVEPFAAQWHGFALMRDRPSAYSNRLLGAGAHGVRLAHRARRRNHAR